MSSAVVRVFNTQGQLLLLKRKLTDRNKTGWCLPGGKEKDAYEPPEITAQRELFEETGLALPLSYIKYVGQYESDIKGKPVTVSVWEAVSKLNAPYTIQLSDEHDGYQWVVPSEYGDIQFAGKTLKAILL